MTVGKTAALTAGLVGAVALGVVIGPTVRDNRSKPTTSPAVTAPAPSAESVAARSEQPARRTAPARTRELSAPTKATPTKATGTVETIAVTMWEPELRDRAKSVLNPGARLEIAAADFPSAEQFMTVAHAARINS